MLADTDIAARTIWLRSAANCGPRMVAATRWTLRVKACALRQTLSFLKSLMPKDGATSFFPQSVWLYAETFYPQFATGTVRPPLARSGKRTAGSGQQRRSQSRFSFLQHDGGTAIRRAAAQRVLLR